MIALFVVLSGCGSSVPSSTPLLEATGGTPGPAASELPAGSAAGTAAPSVIPTSVAGFAFDPESIVGYYQSIGYSCAERRPSATAAGHEYQSCQLVDPDGRTRSLGIVTDPADNVADASFSIRGATGEDVVDPSAVLEPFGAFLGAFLGEDQGTALLPWLAQHLGDAEARTTLGELTIATYTDTPTDFTKLTLELASQAYLDSPAPSAPG